MPRPGIELPQWLRSLPLVSLGLAILWLALGLSVEIGFAGHADRGAAQMRDAVHYALDNPAVRVPPRLLPAKPVKRCDGGFVQSLTRCRMQYIIGSVRRLRL